MIKKQIRVWDFNTLFSVTYSRSDRKYPEGWTTDPGRDSALEFRLSIINAVKEDSGIYRCETPARQSHQVEIIVEGMYNTLHQESGVKFVGSPAQSRAIAFP